MNNKGFRLETVYFNKPFTNVFYSQDGKNEELRLVIETRREFNIAYNCLNRYLFL